jgi:hypothetical protein
MRVDCLLETWGTFKAPYHSISDRFSAQYLGVVYEQRLIAGVRDSISRAVEGIAGKFFAARDRALAEPRAD